LRQLVPSSPSVKNIKNPNAQVFHVAQLPVNIPHIVFLSVCGSIARKRTNARFCGLEVGSQF